MTMFLKTNMVLLSGLVLVSSFNTALGMLIPRFIMPLLNMSFGCAINDNTNVSLYVPSAALTL